MNMPGSRMSSLWMIDDGTGPSNPQCLEACACHGSSSQSLALLYPQNNQGLVESSTGLDKYMTSSFATLSSRTCTFWNTVAGNCCFSCCWLCHVKERQEFNTQRMACYIDQHIWRYWSHGQSWSIRFHHVIEFYVYYLQLYIHAHVLCRYL